MTARAKYFTYLFGITLILIAVFRVILPYYNQYHSYLRIVGKQDNKILIEYKPNLFDLRKLIANKKLKPRRAIEIDFSRKLAKLSDCSNKTQIRGIRGSIEKFLVVRGYCIVKK